MQITFTDFDYLMSKLMIIGYIVEDATLNDEDKSIVIKVNKDKTAYLMGSNLTITHKIKLENYTTDFAEETYIQTRYKSLINFLTTYKTLSVTKVKSVALEPKGTKLSVIVTEQAKGNDSKEYVSRYVVDNTEVKSSLDKLLTMPEPEIKDTDKVNKTQLKWFTDNFMDGISTTTDMYGSIIFTDKECIVLNSAYSLIGKNNVEQLAGTRVSKKCLTFISKALLRENEVYLTKTDKYIVIKTTDSITFLQYSTKMPPYKIYLDMIDTTQSMKINSRYFKDILKRFLVDAKEDMGIDIDCNEGKITVYNFKFKQNIDILASSNLAGYDNIRFRIMPDVMSKIILNTEENMFIYYATKNDNDVIILSDEEQSWYSIIRVKLL